MGRLEESVKELGKSLGFDLVGITGAEPFPRDEEAAIERIRRPKGPSVGSRVVTTSRPAATKAPASCVTWVLLPLPSRPSNAISEPRFTLGE